MRVQRSAADADVMHNVLVAGSGALVRKLADDGWQPVAGRIEPAPAFDGGTLLQWDRRRGWPRRLAVRYPRLGQREGHARRGRYSSEFARPRGSRNNKGEKREEELAMRTHQAFPGPDIDESRRVSAPVR